MNTRNRFCLSFNLSITFLHKGFHSLKPHPLQQGGFIIIFYDVHHWRILWSSYRKVGWLGWLIFFFTYSATINAMYISIYMSVSFYIYTYILSLYISIYVYMSIYLSISIYIYIYLNRYLYISNFIYFFYIFIYIHLCTYIDG